jgi:dephospho-CoA kinase
MTKVLVTGMSGTGKSAVLEMLRLRGHYTVDTDTEEWGVWVTQSDETPDWIWREEVITSLLDQHKNGQLFVAGCKTNQGKFYSNFDHVVLLSAPVDVIVERVNNRSTNPYGKSFEEKAEILRYLDEVEPLLRATSTIEIDATAPLSDVVDQLERLT